MCRRGHVARQPFSVIAIIAALIGLGGTASLGAPTPAPAAPTALTATAASSSSIGLAWTDASSNETGFMIKRAGSLSGKWSTVTTVSANVTTYVNTGLVSGKTYYYKICAVAGRSKSAFSNTASAMPTASNQRPVANAGADRSSPTLTSIAFSGSSSMDPDGTVTSYAWSFGDGGSASGVATSHSYATAGTYTVTLTVTDNGGMTGSDTATVTVSNRSPVATAGPDQSATPGVSVSFSGALSSDADGNIVSHSWTFGDGSAASGASVSHAYANAGTYTATLTVTDNLGSTGVDTAVVTVAAAANRPPVANAGPDQSGMSLSSLTFNGSASSDPDGNIASYAWNFGDGTTAAGSSVSHSFASPGTYNVTLTVTDTLGATGSDSAVVTAMNRAPVARAGSDQSATAGVSVSFSGSASTDMDGNITSYSWNFGDGGSASGMASSHTFSSTGTFTVTLTVTDNLGSTGVDTAVVTVGAAANQPPIANAGPDQSGVSLSSLTFNGSGSSDPDGTIASYAWNFGDGTTAAGSNVSHSFSSPGTFNVTLTVTDNLGATGSDTAVVTAMNRAPIANAGSDRSATTGTPVAFSGASSSDLDGNITSYAWNFGDGGSASGMAPSHAFSSTGTFTVTLTVTDNLGASGSDTAQVTVASSIPSTPTGLTATPVSSGQINLAWTGSAASFKVEHAVSSAGPWSAIGTTSGTTYQEASLSGCSTWFYHVAACNSGGACSAFSSSSSATTLTSAPSAPVAVSAVPASSSQITVSWTSNSSCAASSYRLERATAAAGPWTQAGTTGSTTYTDTGLGASTTYYYRVIGTNTAGDSPYSNLVNGSTSSGNTNVPALWSMALGAQNLTDASYITGVASDAGGNSYVAGRFMGSANLGGGVINSGPGYDIFLAKYDSTGHYLWAKRFNSNSIQTTTATVTVDGAGNIVMTGSFFNALDFGSPCTPISAYSQDAFLVKFSSSGTCMWARNFTSTDVDSGAALAVDGNDNIVLSGGFKGTVGFGGGVTLTGHSTSQADIYLAKFNSSGTILWARNYGGTTNNTQAVRDLAVDGGGNIAMTGLFQSTVDFCAPGPACALTAAVNPVSGPSNDAFIAKYAPDGTPLWARSFGDSQGSDQAGQAVAFDGAGNILASGYAGGSINFGTGTLAWRGAADLYVVKIAPTGTTTWARRYGASGFEQFAYDLAVDPNNDVVVAARTAGVVDYGGGPVPTPDTLSGCNALALKLSSTGGYVWARSFGDNWPQIARAVTTDSSSNVILGGVFSSTIDFGNGTLSSPGTSTDSIFLSKFRP